jgi:hypothetical protein
MRFSYQLPDQPLDELLDLIELMDRLGYWARRQRRSTS